MSLIAMPSINYSNLGGKFLADDEVFQRNDVCRHPNCGHKSLHNMAVKNT